MDEKFYEELKEKVKEIIQEGDGGHDLDHLLRVYNNALLLSKGELVDLDVVKVSALLHDIARPLQDKEKICHAEEGAKMATEILEKMNFPKDKIPKIASVIATHRYSKQLEPETKEAAIIQDADRLDALGAITIARIFAYGGKKNRLLHTPEISPMKVYDGSESSSGINHFYEKILKIKPENFHTKKAQEIAKGRSDFVKQFVERFEKEWGGEL